MFHRFEPEAFHTGNYTTDKYVLADDTQQCGCVFYKQKSPREEAFFKKIKGFINLEFHYRYTTVYSGQL